MGFKRYYIPLMTLGLLILLSFISTDKASDQKKTVQSIAENYTNYPRYDAYIYKCDTAKWQWATTSCFLPLTQGKNRAKGAASVNKMYKFHVRKIKELVEKGPESAPKNQIYVKELWPVKEVNKFAVISGRLPGKQALEGEKWYTPTLPSELLVMYKTEPSEINDNGWVYGVVNMEKDFPVVSLYGKINACTNCHGGGKVLGLKTIPAAAN